MTTVSIGTPWFTAVIAASMNFSIRIGEMLRTSPMLSKP
jgi:hypothetical protein